MSLKDRVLEVSRGRDRVLDAVKVVALGLVVLGHQLAWTTSDGTVINTLDAAPGLWWITWLLQWLPVFFLAAGIGFEHSLNSPTPLRDMYAGRITRLAAPTLPLIAVTAILSVALSWIRPELAPAAGVLPVQLLWFLGVYLLLVAVSPLLVRMRSVWWVIGGAAVVVLVDVLRIQGLALIGWANLPLVWGLFAVAGVQAARWRRVPPTILLTVAVMALAGAAAAIALGPYSRALISTQALPGLSNLAPPTVVLLLAGFAQICVLFAAWPALTRLMARDRVWVPIAIAGSRSMGIYLWHMLLVAVAVGGTLALGLAPAPLGPLWWALHAGVGALVVAAAWVVAGWAPDWGPMLARGRGLPVAGLIAVAILVGFALLGISEMGLYPPLSARPLLGVLPFVPVVAIAVIVLGVALTGRRTRDADPDAR
jgi:fucose 4-O-acetylase-like acetyltransferase